MTELLLTRPIDQAQEFAASVAAALPGRYEPVYWPLIRIEREPAELALDDVQGLLFTSANGVRAFAQASPRRDIPALCVGDGTATAARAAGLIASSARGDAGALAQLAVASHLPGAGAYLHLRGRDTTGDIAGALAVEGIEVREAVLYAARPAMDVPEAA
ncbi:MAG: uroporphyrinogen-III synthase, partial [Pseudomonadota bacterium]